MASTDAKAFPIKNTAYRVSFPILDADGDLVTGATGLDSEVSKDAGTFADCTNEATEIATSSGMYYLDLTSTEMNADTVAVIVKTTSSGAKTTSLVMYPLESGDITVNVTQWAGTTTTTGDIALKTTLAKTTHITGFNDISTANVQTELTTYGALKPTTAGRTLDITTTGEAGIDWANIGAPTTTVNLSGTTVKTATDVAAFVDTEVGAIKTVTDKLDTAMEVDGAVYRFTQNALEMCPGAGSQGNGGTLRFDDIWKWTTAGSVSSGQIRGNVADWNTITELWIHNVTNGTTNLSAYLRVVAADDTIRVQQENNPATWNSYVVTGAITDMTTYVKIPVTLRAGAGVSSPATATNCLVSFFRPNNLDWTDTERQQIRYRLGVDGTAATPAASAYLSSQVSVNAIDDYVDTEVAAIKAKTDALPADPASASSIAASFAVTNGKVDAVDDYIDTEVAAIKAKTDQLTFTGGLVDANASVTLAAGDLTDIADAILKRDWTALTGEAAYSLLNAARMLRNVWNTTGGTLSVKKEDGTTNAWTRTLTTDASADPITGAS